MRPSVRSPRRMWENGGADADEKKVKIREEMEEEEEEERRVSRS